MIDPKTFALAAMVAAGVHTAARAQELPVYLDDAKPIEQRVEDALGRMTLEEKVAMCHAQSKFSSAGVPRLGIPDNWMTDGPHGIRAEVLWDEWNTAGQTNDASTAFPALTCLAATWNEDMVALYGRSIGEEARFRNKNVLLGPGVNIYRTPLNGRNFEYMGEDPFLAATMVVPYIKGVQANGVAACVKHYALNNQEIRRHEVDVVVDDRTLYEIYLPAFKAAVTKGGAWAIMGSYNRYKGQWACQNEYLLNDILRGEWGFDGVVVSDWGGVSDTRQAVFNGLDMEFGTWTDGLSEGVSDAYSRYYLATPFLEMIKGGDKAAAAELDKKVRNILRMAFRTTMDRRRPFGSFATEEHAEAGRRIAQEGIVLLQNRGGVLPIDLAKTKKIAVVGENAIKQMTVGGGSSSLKVWREVSPLDGIRARVGTGAEVVYARGYVGENTGAQDGLSTGDIRDDRSSEELTAEACRVAADADCVIFVGGLNKNAGQDCEGDDRKELGLPYGQDRLIAELARVNPRLAVVVISGNAVAMPWVKDVPAIVQGWYLGTEAGNALASILMGDVNPSGKLPFTFPARLADVGAHVEGEYPGGESETYREGIFVGYRWADKQKTRPLFSFGHGLSYTTFEYGKATADAREMTADGRITVRVKVRNSGQREGSEVVQLYIADLRSSLPRPVKELKGFRKVHLAAGEEREVEFTIDREALSFFDAARHDWTAEPGVFEALIGASSSDIRTKVGFTLQ